MPQPMRVCNGKEYTNALRKRGDLFSFLLEAVKCWSMRDEKNVQKCKEVYSNTLMDSLAIMRYLLKLPYRQLEGYYSGFLNVMGYDIPAPDYTTINRRLKMALKKINDHRTPAQKASKQKLDILIDSTCINIYATNGEHSSRNAEQRLHNHYSQVRKLHVMLDLDGNALQILMSPGYAADSTMGIELIKTSDLPIKSIRADKAYDRPGIRRICYEKDIQQIIPPIITATVRKSRKQDPPGLWNDRNEAATKMKNGETREEGLDEWKKEKGYGKRSKVEAFFHRYKSTFGFSFMSRNEIARQNEIAYKVEILNYFNSQEKPVFELKPET